MYFYVQVKQIRKKDKCYWSVSSFYQHFNIHLVTPDNSEKTKKCDQRTYILILLFI